MFHQMFHRARIHRVSGYPQSFSPLLSVDNGGSSNSLSEGNSMKTYSRLTLAFLLLILVVPPVGSSAPPKDGPQVEYYFSGQKQAQLYYMDGKLISASSWTPERKPCPITKIVDGSGIFVVWHENGKKKEESHWKNGKEEGLWTEWYQNGQKWQEKHYKNGKLDALWTWWYDNGQKYKEEHYKNGKRDGLRTWWDENGQKASEAHYKNGKELSRKRFR